MKQTEAGKTVISSPDALPHWQDWNPDNVTKVVLGKLTDNGTPALTLRKNEVLPDFSKKFPKLTSLYLWNLKGLSKLPPLPASLRCLDIRGCRELASIDNLPSDVKVLICIDCPSLNDPPVQGPRSLPALQELCLDGCQSLRNESFNLFLKAAPALEIFHASRCPGLEQIGPTAAGDRSPIWPEGLFDIRLNETDSLRTLPKRWPPGLTRLELAGSKIRGPLPDFPPALDFLNLAKATHLTELPVIQGLPRTLFLHGSGLQLPPELLGADGENVAAKVLADQEESLLGVVPDNELKVILLGNGRSGKSSLARRWVDGAFDPKEPSTHGVRHWRKQISVLLEDPENQAPESVPLNIWDFAGQDFYHNTHRLFLQSKAIFVICENDSGLGSDQQTDEVEKTRADSEELDHALDYWVKQVESLGKVPGLEILPPIIRVKTKIDRVQSNLAPTTGDWLRISAKSDTGFNDLERRVAEQARKLLGGWKRRSIPLRAMKVKRVLNQWIDANDAEFKAAERESRNPNSPHTAISKSEMLSLIRRHCPNGPYFQNPNLLLERFHLSGVVFHDPKNLPDQVLLDQRWATQAIYVFASRDSKKNIRSRLSESRGRFRLSELAKACWNNEGYSNDEQKMLLQFMVSCGMCFELLSSSESATREAVYLAPGFLPKPEEADGVESANATWKKLELTQVSEPEMQALVSQLGRRWSRSAELWRWGGRVKSARSGASVRADWRRQNIKGDYFGTLRIWFGGPRDIDFESEIRGEVEAALQNPTWQEAKAWNQDWPLDRKRIPEMDRQNTVRHDSRDAVVGRRYAISYARSDANHPLIGEIPELLGTMLREGNRHQVLICSENDGPADLSNFMQELARQDLVIVFWSRKYFFSEYCMAEMMNVYEQPPAGTLPLLQVKIVRLDGARLATEKSRGVVDAGNWVKCWTKKAGDRRKNIRKIAGEDYAMEDALLEADGLVDKWFKMIFNRKFPDFWGALSRYRLADEVRVPQNDAKVQEVTQDLRHKIEELVSKPDALIAHAQKRFEKGEEQASLEFLLAAFRQSSPTIPNAAEIGPWLDRLRNEKKVTTGLHAHATLKFGQMKDFNR